MPGLGAFLRQISGMRSQSAARNATNSRRYRSARRQRRKFWWLKVIIVSLLVGLLYYHINALMLQPQAILVLGGSPEREAFAAEFAQDHPKLPVWVSSGSPADYARWVFAESEIPGDRLHLDYRAVDTVTNFTSLVDDFEDQNIRSLYLITSDYHMRRARTIGTIVLGSRGIEFEAVPIPSDLPKEPLGKVARDAARSFLWVTTGRTGASLKDHPSLQSRFLSPHP